MLTPIWKLMVSDFLVVGLDHAKFGFYRFQSFLFIVAIVISIQVKTLFGQTSIQSQSVVKIS